MPGAPITSEPAGITLPSVTSAPAPTSELSPITAPLRTIAPMPISTLLPMVQPWTMARWPMVQPMPTVAGKPGSVCTTTCSCRLESAPMTIASPSPRTTAPNQMPTLSPSVTLPITVAVGAIQ